MSDSLPFSDEKQCATLGHMIVSDRFWAQVQPFVAVDWFGRAEPQKLFRALKDFREKYRRGPSFAELKELPMIMAEEAGVRRSLCNLVDLCGILTETYKLDALGAELSVWMQHKVIRSMWVGVDTAFRAKNMTRALELVKQAQQDLQGAALNNDPTMSWDDFGAIFQARQNELENGCTWGSSVVDRVLCPEAKEGALLRGDATLVCAPTNVGKTTTLLTIAGANVLRKKSVLILFHEGKDTGIYTQMWCTMLRCTRPELMRMYADPAQRPKIAAWSQVFKRYLDLVPLQKAGLTIEEVVAFARRKQDERVARYGVGYDLIGDDYPAKLTTKQQAGKLEHRQATQVIYQQMNALGLEFGCHTISLIQANREAAKINQRIGSKGEIRLLMATDISEASGPSHDAQNVITINREPGIKDFVTYYIDKAKVWEGGAGHAIICRSDIAHGLSHADHLGATYYKGKMSVADKAMMLLQQFQGQEVPPPVLA